MARLGSFAATSQETLAVSAAISLPTKRRYVEVLVEVVIVVSLSSMSEEETFLRLVPLGTPGLALVIRGLRHSIRFKLCAARDEGSDLSIAVKAAAVCRLSPSSWN
jgi:hypothetical protein